MAAANRPTAVHFSLVFFVMVTLILTVTTYLGWKRYYEQDALRAAAESNASELQRAVSNYQSETDNLKQLLGYPYDQLGGAGTTDANTVSGAIAADLQALGGPQAGPTLRATVSAMRTALNNALNENASLKASLSQNRDQLVALESGAQSRVDTFKASQESSEQQLQAQISEHQQEINEKNGEIEKWKRDYNLANVEKGQIQDEYERFRRQMDERLMLLERQIDFYKDQLDELTQVSFEREDGRIVSVDNTTRTVWINIGKADGLREQVTFSVYTADHRGIGRGVQDIKAKIEVTRILEPHLAEARILDEDLFRPISEGDPIYSPLWAAGRKEYFAIVGRPDLDEDGKSDWDLFFEIVRNAGAEVELIINDEAVREPADAKLSARTKFLIIGDMDDPLEFSGIPEKQALATKMFEQRDVLINEARLYGIRVVRLNDFLDFIGWKPEQRLWQPGTHRRFNLQRGAQSASTDESFKDRTSGGQTSELFRQNRMRTQKESGGTTSGLYRNQ